MMSYHGLQAVERFESIDSFLPDMRPLGPSLRRQMSSTRWRAHKLWEVLCLRCIC